jgi:hypothetical protein
MDDQAAKPPSMVKFAPVMNPDSGPARYDTMAATSSPRP